MMRRKDREITDFHAMLQILEACDCCRLGLVDCGQAYLVPLNFGYEVQRQSLVLYFHSACEGKKIDLIRQQGDASFELDCGHHLVEKDTACQYSFLYQCIMGSGSIRLCESEEEKLHGLERIMEHYAPGQAHEFHPGVVAQAAVIRLEVSSWTCKSHTS